MATTTTRQFFHCLCWCQLTPLVSLFPAAPNPASQNHPNRLVKYVPYDSRELARRERFPNEATDAFDYAVLFEDVVGIA